MDSNLFDNFNADALRSETDNNIAQDIKETCLAAVKQGKRSVEYPADKFKNFNAVYPFIKSLEARGFNTSTPALNVDKTIMNGATLKISW